MRTGTKRSLIWSLTVVAFCAAALAIREPASAAADAPAPAPAKPPAPAPAKTPDPYPAGVTGDRRPLFDAVESALQWLADHQNTDGSWKPDAFLNDSIRTAKGAKSTQIVEFNDVMNACRGSPTKDTGDPAYEVGLTGLALSAFVGNGHAVPTARHVKIVERAADFLVKSQQANGCFGPSAVEEFVYCHALATKSVAELWLAAGTKPAYFTALKKATAFIVRAQNPGLGWRYGIRTFENDSSVTGAMVVALAAAKAASALFDEKTVFAGANAFLDKVTDKGMTGYITPSVGNSRVIEAEKYDQNGALDALSLLARLLSGKRTPKDKEAATVAARIAAPAATPKWGRTVLAGTTTSFMPYSIDFYNWCYATLALQHMGGSALKTWETALLTPCLRDHQRGWLAADKTTFGEKIRNPAFNPDGSENKQAGRWLLDEHGSWDPVDAWGSCGGRVYATAINALTLQMSWRHAVITPKNPRTPPFVDAGFAPGKWTARTAVPAALAAPEETDPKDLPAHRQKADAIRADAKKTAEEQRLDLTILGARRCFVQIRLDSVSGDPVSPKPGTKTPQRDITLRSGWCDARTGAPVTLPDTLPTITSRADVAGDSQPGDGPANDFWISEAVAVAIKRAIPADPVAGVSIVFEIRYDPVENRTVLTLRHDLSPLAPPK